MIIGSVLPIAHAFSFEPVNSINASKFDFVLVEETDIFDIDNMTDWILAEKKMNG